MGMSDNSRGAQGAGREAGKRSASDHPAPRASRLAPASGAALVLFAKAPVPGQVKTRLCPPLTPDEAATLHGTFVLDALESSASAASRGLPKQSPKRFDRILACWPSSEHVFFQIMQERHGVGIIDQVGDDLGARMAAAADEMFARGYKRVLLAGTDLPDLPESVYEQALALLATPDVVLGPSFDGGYYLIGLAHPAAQLFRDVPWSTDQVLHITLAKAEQTGLSTAQLSMQRDIDTLDDLLNLIGAVAPSGRQGAPRAKPAVSKRTAGALRLVAERIKERKGA
jgi:rSAM/selenodomain-associated transferase 1